MMIHKCKYLPRLPLTHTHATRTKSLDSHVVCVCRLYIFHSSVLVNESARLFLSFIFTLDALNKGESQKEKTTAQKKKDFCRNNHFHSLCVCVLCEWGWRRRLLSCTENCVPGLFSRRSHRNTQMHCDHFGVHNV